MLTTHRARQIALLSRTAKPGYKNASCSVVRSKSARELRSVELPQDNE